MFRRTVYFLLLASLLAGCAAATSADPNLDIQPILLAYPELNSRAWTQDEVKRVVDGDTFETKNGEKVRLIGVNTPETVKVNSPVEAYGKEASEFTKKALTGQSVYMFKDTGDRDNYGRLLRYVFLAGEPTMFNETLLAEGYANTMSVPPNVAFQQKFLEVEREARLSNKGLWGKGDSSSASTSVSKCAQPRIKGNINSKKEKIYHVPGGSHYEMTIAEALFCDEKEAQAAGYRKSKD